MACRREVILWALLSCSTLVIDFVIEERRQVKDFQMREVKLRLVKKLMFPVPYFDHHAGHSSSRRPGPATSQKCQLMYG